MVDELDERGEELLTVPPTGDDRADSATERAIAREVDDERAEASRADRRRPPRGAGKVDPVEPLEVGLERLEVLPDEELPEARYPGRVNP